MPVLFIRGVVNQLVKPPRRTRGIFGVTGMCNEIDRKNVTNITRSVGYVGVSLLSNSTDVDIPATNMRAACDRCSTIESPQKWHTYRSIILHVTRIFCHSQYMIFHEIPA